MTAAAAASSSPSSASARAATIAAACRVATTSPAASATAAPRDVASSVGAAGVGHDGDYATDGGTGAVFAVPAGHRSRCGGHASASRWCACHAAPGWRRQRRRTPCCSCGVVVAAPSHATAGVTAGELHAGAATQHHLTAAATTGAQHGHDTTSAGANTQAAAVLLRHRPSHAGRRVVGIGTGTVRVVVCGGSVPVLHIAVVAPPCLH